MLQCMKDTHNHSGWLLTCGLTVASFADTSTVFDFLCLFFPSALAEKTEDGKNSCSITLATTL